MTDIEQTTKKKLNELRVVDLRHELEKRGLDKNGVKPALVDKLTKALEEEGKNPEEYYFDIVIEKPSTKPAIKRSSRKFKEGDTDGAPEEDEEEEREEEEEKQEENQNALSKEDATDVEKTEESNAKLSEENPQCNGNEADGGIHKSLDVSRLSPPKPETSPVLAPLTIEDIIKLDTSSKTKASDNDSMIVNPDDTQSDIDSSVHESQSVDEAMQEGEENADNCKADSVEGTEMNAEDHPSADSSECPASKTTDSEKNQIAVKDEKSASKNDSKRTTDDKSVEKSKISQVDDSSAAGKTSAAENVKSVEQTTDSSKPVAKRKSSTEEKSSADGSKKSGTGGKNLWVSGLAEKTRANDLKALFSKYGKVSTAKIVTNAKTPGARCYGFIVMTTKEEADLCIEKLNQTELHGKTISVEKTNREPTGSIKRTELKAIQKTAQNKSDTKTDEKAGAHKDSKSGGKDSSKSGDKSKDDKSKSDKSKSVDKSKSSDKDKVEKKDDKDSKRDSKKSPVSRDHRTRDRSRDKRRRERRTRSRSRGRGGRFSNARGGYRGGFNRGFGSRNFAPTRSFDDRFRERERSRDRDLDRRRLDILRQREIERQNKEESIRLERERERLRIEREKLERERAEVLRLEREKQRMERERLEREKIELRKRTQMTLEERRGIKRSFEIPMKEADPFWDDRKRPHREDTPLEALTSFEDFGRSHIEFGERRSDFDRSKSDMSPAFAVSSRREVVKREHERSPFHRGRGSRDMPDRGRGDWKSKPNRERSFERERNSFNDRGGRNFERPHPWEGGAPTREQNKFGNEASMGNSQWGPVTKAPDNWSRAEQPTPQDRWGNVDRGQSSMGHAPNMGHTPNQLMFSGQPTNEMINQMGNHFPVDRFNPSVMRRF